MIMDEVGLSHGALQGVTLTAWAIDESTNQGPDEDRVNVEWIVWSFDAICIFP